MGPQARMPPHEESDRYIRRGAPNPAARILEGVELAPDGCPECEAGVGERDGKGKLGSGVVAETGAGGCNRVVARCRCGERRHGSYSRGAARAAPDG